VRIVLLGPPGCGKGTQGELIEKKYGFPKVSTGDLLRQTVAEETPLGKRAETQMRHGGLVNDEIVEEMVRERIFKEDCRQGYVLDGFPRNISQAQKLEEMDGNRSEVVIEIHLTEENLIKRLEARRICPRCKSIYNVRAQNPKREGMCNVCGARLIQREDDKKEVIKERLKVYHQQTEPLVGYYQKKKNYRRVNGSGGIETVFRNIYLLLEAEMAESKEKEARR